MGDRVAQALVFIVTWQAVDGGFLATTRQRVFLALGLLLIYVIAIRRNVVIIGGPHQVHWCYMETEVEPKKIV